MSDESIYRGLADAVLLLHLGVILFVVGGLVYAVAGSVRGWSGARNLAFRLVHLAAIGFVVLQSWLGQLCPLTTLESRLREQAGSATYTEGFIEHWVQRIIFFDAPPEAFIAAYTAFGLAVAWAWWRFPPRRRARPGRLGSAR